MQSILSHIQEEITQYTEAIKGITGTDVEIVDREMIRVAGTGVYKYMLNINVADEGHIYRHSMLSKKTILVENPREHPLCFSCTKQSFCTEKLDLTTPIFFNDEVIGVISIICLTDEQKSNLMKQFEKFINFIEQIAALISGKVFEYFERLRAQNTIITYRTMIEYIDRGVITINQFNQIWHANLSAKRLLEIESYDSNQTITIEHSAYTSYGDEEGYIILDNHNIHVIYNKIPLSAIEGDRLTMIIFQKVTDNTYDPEIYTHIKFETLIGNSSKILELKKNISKIAASHTNVLITGETGTGKEVVATSIYQQSIHNTGPFVTINCAAIPDQLLESELFGYVKGAFSGADPKGRIGKFELANNGTLFLDEIGDMPIHLQAKLLRVLQEGKISRIGSNTEINIDVRVIAATNKDLLKLIDERLFREDLYYRLNVVPLHLIPLRERKSDISYLADYFTNQYANTYQQKLIPIPTEILNIFYQYDWPGNIRELRNVIEYMYVMKGEAINFDKSHLPHQLLQNRLSIKKINEQPMVVTTESELLKQKLDKNGSNLLGKKQTAKELNISLATLYRKLKKFKLDD